MTDNEDVKKLSHSFSAYLKVDTQKEVGQEYIRVLIWYSYVFWHLQMKNII